MDPDGPWNGAQILSNKPEEDIVTIGSKMSRNPITVSPDTSLLEAKALLKREGISRLPVLDKHNKLVGIVTEFDLVNAAPSTASSLDMWEMTYLLGKLKIEKVMTTKVITISEDTTVEEAARLMAENNISGLPVLRGDLLVGIITESDLFRIFTELFGARRIGVRVTVLLPEKRGELASFAQAIAQAGGNIVSFVTYPGDDPTNILCTFKVEGIEQEALYALIAPLAEEIVDVRTV